MNKKEPISFVSLLISLVSLVIGVIFCFNGGDAIFKFIGYSVSAILILSGVLKALLYILGRKKNGSTFGDFIMGLLFVGLGVVIAIFPKFIPTTISIVLGVLILFNGINRLILGLAVKKIDDQGSKIFAIESLFMILLGIIIMTQVFIKLLGVFMIVYAISEMVGYIYYTSQNKDYSEVLNKKVPQDIKEKEAKEAQFEETKEE